MASYTVKSGDTLSKIAATLGMTWQQLWELNKNVVADPNKIFPGQVLQTSSSGGGGQPQQQAGVNDSALIDKVYEAYGHYAPFLDIPEIRAVLLDAAKNEWSPARLEAAIRNTNYWRQHTQAQLQWPMLSPAEQQQRQMTVASQIQEQMISNFGLSWINQNNPSMLTSRALEIAKSIASGASTLQEWQTRLFLEASKIQGTPAWTQIAKQAQQKHEPANLAERFHRMAKEDYWLDMPFHEAEKWANQVFEGLIPEADFERFLRDKAANMFGHAELIEKGITPREFLGDYTNMAARLLEIDNDMIPNDPKIFGQIKSWAMNDELPNLWEFEKHIKSLPEWRTTGNANDEIGRLTTELSRRMGRG